MKIVVTDGATLNPGDLNWNRLEKLGDCQIYERTAPEETVPRCKSADIAVTNKVVFDRSIIESLPSLKCISVTATGYNIIDVEAARDNNVVVMNVPEYGTPSVAQMAFALLLELTQHVGHHSKTVHKGKWSACNNFCYWDYPLVELGGLKMGIVGFGRIGRRAAKLAKAFGMKVLAYDPISPVDEEGVEQVNLQTLFSESDVVSLHCPVTAETEEFVNKEHLNKMKKSAFLINTSRGQLVNEQDLADALNSGRIAGAGLDVLSIEPPKADNPLQNAKNCYITPHIAWATKSARERLMNITIDNIEAFIKGTPQNVVS